MGSDARLKMRWDGECGCQNLVVRIILVSKLCGKWAEPSSLQPFGEAGLSRTCSIYSMRATRRQWFGDVSISQHRGTTYSDRSAFVLTYNKHHILQNPLRRLFLSYHHCVHCVVNTL